LLTNLSIEDIFIDSCDSLVDDKRINSRLSSHNKVMDYKGYSLVLTVVATVALLSPNAAVKVAFAQTETYELKVGDKTFPIKYNIPLVVKWLT
jgi:hypothetical protein